LFSAAIFDMDGLLIDSERIIMQACIAAAQSHGITYTQTQFVELIGRNLNDSTRVMTSQLGGEDNFKKVAQSVDEILAQREDFYPLRPGVREMLDFLNDQKIACGVASSSYQAVIQRRLSKVGVLKHFSHITSGDEVPRGKPNPDIYLLALTRLGVNAQDCIAFEDSELGAQAAIAAGLKVVVVPDLKQPSTFVQENAWMIVDSLHQALEQFDCPLW
jgi:HAD superfamily hydrolase (TIGR01509 family)